MLRRICWPAFWWDRILGALDIEGLGFISGDSVAAMDDAVGLIVFAVSFWVARAITSGAELELSIFSDLIIVGIGVVYVLFSVLIYELLGPMLTKQALTKAGEICAMPRPEKEKVHPAQAGSRSRH